LKGAQDASNGIMGSGRLIKNKKCIFLQISKNDFCIGIIARFLLFTVSLDFQTRPIHAEKRQI
jgi:hypothetical protein